MDKIKKLINRWKEKRHVDLEDQDFSVSLKPIAGIKPAIYLRIIFSLFVILVLFLTLILPGIRNPGSNVIINSQPSESAVLVDGNYRGITPCKIFVKKGNHQFSLKYPGCAENNLDQKIKGRIFLSALFPKRVKMTLTTETTDPFARIEPAVARFRQLSCYHSFRKGTTPPPILTPAVLHLLSSTDRGEAEKAFESLVAQTIHIANIRVLKKDLLSAMELWYHTIPIKWPQDPAIDILKLISINSENHPGLLFEYLYSLPVEDQRWIKEDPLYQKTIDSLKNYYGTTISANYGKPLASAKSINGLIFSSFQGGVTYTGEESPADVLTILKENRIPDTFPRLFQSCRYYLSTEMVSGSAYLKLIPNSEEYKKSQLAEGRINRYYAPVNNTQPVTNISYYSALDYINLGFSRNIGNFKAGIATSFELYAAFENGFLTDKDLIDQQEWASDAPTLQGRSLKSDLPENLIMQHTLKGNLIDSFPAEFCTNTTSFRICLKEVETRMLPYSVFK